MKDFSKILNNKISTLYLGIAVFGILLGAVLTTFCIDLYAKINATFLKSRDNTHMIINKEVSLLNTLSLSDNSFSEQDVSDLKNQAFIQDVGEIISSSCRIWAFRDQNPLKFKSDIFFEALDDRFLDKVPYEWKWKTDDDFIPVMVNADFLKLYNFAFSKTQNLPQFTPSTIGQLTVLVEVKGNGKKKIFKSRIVGVSERAPSFVVPKPFLEYVNNTFGKPESNKKFNRLMLKVSNPSNPLFIDYLTKNGIVANADLLNTGSSKTILTQILGGEIFQALVIMLLAIILLVLTFELFISNSRKDILLLKNLGFHSKELLSYFYKRFFIIFALQLVAVISINVALGYWVQQELASIGYGDISILSHLALFSIVIYFGFYFLFFKWRISKALNH